MRFFPSQRMPPLDYSKVDWRLRTAIGKDSLTSMWEGLWREGCAAGRAEGIVATLLLVLLVAVAVLVAVQLVRRSR